MSCLLVALLLSAPGAPDTAVVCPGAFRPALQPWAELRTSQGRRLAWVSSAAPPAEIRAQLQQLARAGSLQCVVLVGDAEPGLDRDPALRARCVPTHHRRAVVNVRWGSEPEIAADNWYADLDGDRVPEVALGRLPADSPEQLSALVRKIVDYEQQPRTGPWRRHVNVVAGVGGFGRLADAALEATVKRLLTDGIPPQFATSVAYASWTSPYCPQPHGFRQAVVDQFNQGCLFWIYIGHGQRRWLDVLRTPAGGFPIFHERDVVDLRCRETPPIACFLACYTAAFDQPQDCLAETLLAAPQGPVAVVGGSRMTMPYAMAVLGTELLDEVFVHRTPTIGQALLRAKQRSMQPTGSVRRTGLDALAALISPPPVDLAAEREEHLDLFHLLGDPLLALRYPQPVRVVVPAAAVAGQELEIEIDSPLPGTATIELVTRRDLLTFAAPHRGEFDAALRAAEDWQAVFQRANDPRWVATQAAVAAGPCRVRLAVPAAARGPAHVRLFIAGESDFAAGAADLVIGPPPGTRD